MHAVRNTGPSARARRFASQPGRGRSPRRWCKRKQNEGPMAMIEDDADSLRQIFDEWMLPSKAAEKASQLLSAAQARRIPHHRAGSAAHRDASEPAVHGRRDGGGSRGADPNRAPAHRAVPDNHAVPSTSGRNPMPAKQRMRARTAQRRDALRQAAKRPRWSCHPLTESRDGLS